MIRFSLGSVQKRNFEKENGFVLITALMVIFLVVSIVTTVALITAADLRASAKARAIVTTRITAESVSDAVYSSIARETTNFITKAQENFRIPGPIINSDTAPLEPLTVGGYGNWFALLPDGSLVRCEDDPIEDYRRNVCFKARIKRTSMYSVVELENREEVVLEIVARDACLIDGTDIRGCVYRKFTQTFRTREYLNTVSLYESEDPAAVLGVTLPYKVAYLPSDILEGNIHSNDLQMYYCGAVDFNDATFFNEGGSKTESINVASCDATPTRFDTNVEDNKFIPTQVDKSGRSDDGEIATVFSHLAGGTSSPYYVNSSTAIIELESDKIVINHVDLSYPSNGVVYVNGDLTIHGEYSRSLTIAASGSVTIDDNLIASPNNPLFGITTERDIIIKCVDDGGQCASREIDGILSAPNGTIYNNEWNTKEILDPNSPNIPRITLYGALIAKHHPVFGAYTSMTNAKLKYGLAKTLVFDTRLRDVQPPYFFRTTQAKVVRSAIESSGCGTDPDCATN